MENTSTLTTTDVAKFEVDNLLNKARSERKKGNRSEAEELENQAIEMSAEFEIA